MKLGVKGFLLTLLFSLAAFSLLVYISTTNDKVQALPLEAAQGKSIYQKKACVECHTLFGNGGYWGGDLTKAYAKFGSEGLKAYLTQPPLMRGAKKKRHDQLTTEEADQIIAYLNFVNSIDTMNWPPSPVGSKQK